MMKTRTVLMIIAASCLLGGCGEYSSFKITGEECTNFQYIKAENCTYDSCPELTSDVLYKAAKEKYECTDNDKLCLDAAVVKDVDFSENFKTGICPFAFPYCLNDIENRQYCSDKNIAPCKDETNNKVYGAGSTVCHEENGGSVTVVCSNGEWVISKICDNACNEDKTGCSELKRQCDGNEHQSVRCFKDAESGSSYESNCNDGKWEFRKICSGDCDAEGESCNEVFKVCHIDNVDKEFKHNEKYCDLISDAETGKTVSVMLQCNDGDWDFIRNCDAECLENHESCSDQKKSCREGELQYEHNTVHCFEDSDRSIGIVKKCNDGNWKDVEKCSTSCNARMNSCGVCVNDTSYYENNAQNECLFRICSKGTYVVSEKDSRACSYTDGSVQVSCSSKNGETECGMCRNGDLKCDSDAEQDNAGVISLCSDGQWQDEAVMTCKGSCRGNQCGSCIDGTTKYENNTDNNCLKYTCIEGEWSVNDEFVCDYSCRMDADIADNDELHCGDCLNGNTECRGENDSAQMQTCHNGIWQFPTSCNGYSCIVNNKGESVCSDCHGDESYYKNDSDKVCHQWVCENGSWLDKKAETDVSCGENGFGECLDGTGICKGNDFYSCIDGKLTGPVNCNKCISDEIGIANCLFEECDENYNNSCENGIRSYCDNGVTRKEICPSESCKTGDKAGECAECRIDDAGCMDEVDNAVMWNCKEGKIEKIPCVNKDGSGVSCHDNECGECINGSVKCESTDAGNIQRICKNGMWSEKQNCGNHSCTPDNECGECRTGNTSCENGLNSTSGYYKECMDGKWAEPRVCMNNVSCHSGVSCGECVDGEQKCEDNKKSHCQNGEWGEALLCEGNASCHENVCGECINGSVEYYEILDDKQNIQCLKRTCENGLWVIVDNACENNVSCKYERGGYTGCGECQNYEYSHSGKYYLTCYEGISYSYWCGAGVSTLGEYYGCSNGDTPSCYNEIVDGNVIGKLRDGDNKCDPMVSCTVTGIKSDLWGTKLETKCGQCLDYTTKCKDENTMQTCVNGVWGFDQHCDNKCNGNACQQ